MSNLTNTLESAVRQPPAQRRVLSGRNLERLCHNDPITAATLAYDLAAGEIVLTRPTPEQSIRITGASTTGYCAVHRLRGRSR
jgi:hypothetical protein